MSSVTNIQDIKRSSDPESPMLYSVRSSSLQNSSSRSKSLSPRKRNANQPLHIRMNLTETQMNKITDAFTHKLSAARLSPGKIPPMISQNKTESLRHSGKSKTASEPKDASSMSHEALNITSPTFSELMPRARDDSIAERRQRIPPAHIEVTAQHRSGTRPQRPQMEHVHDGVSPLSSHRASYKAHMEGQTSSTYSAAAAANAEHPPPLNIPSNRRSQQQRPGNNGVLDMYNDWTQFYSSGASPLSPRPVSGRGEEMHHPRRSKSLAEGMKKPTSPMKPSHNNQPVRLSGYAAEAVSESPLFSPLPLYFRGQDFPSVKRGGKTLIGNNGWLEKTGQEELGQEYGAKANQKKIGIFDSIKKIAKDMTELHYPSRRLPNTKASGAQLSISLDAREQSLLYCELEYHLTCALNSYISRELEKGRLVPLNFKKITDAWYQQGRPRVVGFRFDLETQIDLVALHVNEFTFCGRRQCNPVEIGSLLHTMRVNARAMRIRTFCQPDSVIAKQLVDSQSLFGMIGVPDEANRALAEIVHFFKVIVEREHSLLQQRQKEHRQTVKFPSNDN